MYSNMSDHKVYDEYLQAMKKVHRESMGNKLDSHPVAHLERDKRSTGNASSSAFHQTAAEASRISTMASMVPDEIIYNHVDLGVREYETALMFIDVSGFTDLCEVYTKTGRGGPSKITSVLNAYIGSMIQEILAHDGDILKFAGDAFITMWKKTAWLTMSDIMHTAIDCGLVLQRNYGHQVTDIGVTMKIKVAISAGKSFFSIIGGGTEKLHYVIVGQPVWDVKIAEYASEAGDVLTAASVWNYVNEADYCTQQAPDGRHTKVLGVGSTWKKVEKSFSNAPVSFSKSELLDNELTMIKSQDDSEIHNKYREYSLRPSVVTALSGDCRGLRQYMVTPVLRAVDNDEPMEYLAEVRRVVIVFLNIVTRAVSSDVVIGLVDKAYKRVCLVTSASGGLVNKVSMFDKDMMFLVVFGLRGLKDEHEAKKAIQCALHLKRDLVYNGIKSVSIGITSGKTYCGVVGHFLRREYTVIGSAVNMAARLMIAYQGLITCDKETFLRSKLNQEMFTMVKTKELKGIADPGPIYEVNQRTVNREPISTRHPILGRSDELHRFNLFLKNATNQRNQRFTRYKDHRFGMVIAGPKTVGKHRFMKECLMHTPKDIDIKKIALHHEDQLEFSFVRRIITNCEGGALPNKISRDDCENKVRRLVRMINLKPEQIYALNKIFDCRFPLPDCYCFEGDILATVSVRDMLQEMCMKAYKNLTLIAVRDAQNMDDASWRILIILLDTKSIILLMTICDDYKLSQVAQNSLDNHVFVKIHLPELERWYHAALACQLLDVQAIPTDLEKIIQSASGGMPGWIQNFVISLVQRGELTTVTVTRTEALAAGAVLAMETPLPGFHSDEPSAISTGSVEGHINSVLSLAKDGVTTPLQDPEIIQMAVLSDNFTFENVKNDMTMDAIILKTYDSLNSFEKMLLKCSSVLGEVFSRRMLQHLLQSDNERKVAQAVEKLFRIRVLECEGGDFTHETSLVLIHPAPFLPAAKPPFCACLGTRKLPNCRDLPMYAFCGYMKFKHSLFRTTTYDLLTETQKQELHSRALLYLERYARRCTYCGAGCFINLLGQRCDDGLIPEPKAIEQIRKVICQINVDAQPDVANLTPFTISEFTEMLTLPIRQQSVYESYRPADLKRLQQQKYLHSNKKVRSFSSLDLASCECNPILMALYCQIIEHCRGAAMYESLIEAYIEFADLSVLHLNIPQAIRLLFEIENFIMSDKFTSITGKPMWYKNYLLGRIYSLRGACMLESGDTSEAEKQLFAAMKLFCDPFPTSKSKITLRNIQESFYQKMSFVMPSAFVRTESGLEGRFYEEVAETLNRLVRLFQEKKEPKSVQLASKWSLNYALRTEANFRLLCVSYANRIANCRSRQDFSMCLKLEERAMKLCHRKLCQLDVTEVHAVCFLYTSIFLFYVEYGKKVESLEFGLSVMHMISNLSDLSTRQMLVVWMLKLLLSDIRIHDMVAIMREFFYMTSQYDLSSETWYYFYSMVILLDTGYCVETYCACEKFYMKKGDAIVKSKTPEAAWNFFVCMWLVTVRVGAWEQAVLWGEKVKLIQNMKFEKYEFGVMILVRLAEGLLITLVNEMDKGNTRQMLSLMATVKTIFKDIREVSHHAPMYKPRYNLLMAYFCHIRRKRLQAFKYVNKACDLARNYGHGTLLIWAEHTRNHWKGNLKPNYINYWLEHTDPENLLDYRDHDSDKSIKIIPYTLPLPKGYEI